MSKSLSLFEIKDSRITNNSTLFNLINPTVLDPNKETMLVVTFKNFGKEYNHIYGFSREIIEVLKDKYNLMFVGKVNQSDMINVANFYLLSQSGYNHLNGTKFKRKKENADNVAYNREILYQEFEKAFGKIKIDKVLFAHSNYYELPFTSYFSGKYAELKNEFHDYIGNDPEKLQEVRGKMADVANVFDERVSLLAFTMYYKNIFMNLCKWTHQRNPIKHLYTFTIDPMGFNYYFDHIGIPTTRYYFANDTRGTRNYKEFPIAHLQHLVHENRFNHIDPANFDNKENDFFYMGSIVHEKGGRSQLWYQFLHDLHVENSNLWVPIKLNGVFKNKNDVNSKYSKDAIKKAEEKFSQLVDDIKTHPNYSGFLLPQDVKRNIIKYKYTFVLRCVSYDDSLNFRPVYYAYLKILPFFDKEYDPSYLQIPKEIQDKLVVTSAQEIQEKIAYYNQHDDERLELLEKLRTHFGIENFENDWQSKILNYFN